MTSSFNTVSDEVGPRVMVAVRNAHKSYVRGKSVLRGLNMTVHQGTIYAFLGPSGCGKTTLLSCLGGETMLESGEITLGVQYKDEIGYMPQDTALTLGLSIKEIIHFYTLLFGFNNDYEKKRKQELFSVLDIPPETRIVGSLSGGEQRRVSLCISLFHDPQLLILDEPTVGLDPILSNRIWEYFGELTVSKKKTVLITTHYIEEATQANRVGIMRSGVLLAEGCPQTIMAEHGTNKLEDVFLRLCVLQEECGIFQQTSEEITEGTFTAQRQSPILNRESFSHRHVCAHMRKNGYWLSRNKQIFLFLMTLPLVQSTLFILAIGRDPEHLKMGIVNEELKNGRAMDCKVPYTFNCSAPTHSSCLYMEYLERRKMILVNFEDEESAMKAAKKNDVWGYIVLWSNYTPSLMDRLEYNLASSEDVVNSSEVAIRIDMSNQYIGYLLRRDMLFAFSDYLEDVHKTCGWPWKAAKLPIGYEPAIYGSLFPDFTSFGVPAVLSLCAFFIPMMITVGSIVMEKQEGVLERNLISGLTSVETLAANAIFVMGMLVVQEAGMLAIIYIGFDVPMKGSITLTSSLSFLCGFCGVCYGFVVATFTHSDSAASLVGLGSFFPLTMVSGMFWPFEAMHPVLQVVAYFLPLTLITDGFRSITTRGHGFTHRSVYPGALMLLAWIFIFILCTYIAIRRKSSHKIITKC